MTQAAATLDRHLAELAEALGGDDPDRIEAATAQLAAQLANPRAAGLGADAAAHALAQTQDLQGRVNLLTDMNARGLSALMAARGAPRADTYTRRG